MIWRLRIWLPLMVANFWLVTGLPAQNTKSDWHSMFDGKSLAGWKETPFMGQGEVRVEKDAIILGTGLLTGVNWAGQFPTSNYEVRLEAARLEGSDFFAGITFPVGDSYCSWINGGWGGDVVGLSSLDGLDASENETTRSMQFEQGRWYAFRLRVTDKAITAWIDDEQVIKVELAKRVISLREGEIYLSKPFGIASYTTRAGLRDIAYREIR
ncbi:MAG: DUF1080 domain-containing protein [Acidobacteria bacterium]|nr:DUF1080 domain-containing protein [Acidobacteriota bacterium]